MRSARFSLSSVRAIRLIVLFLPLPFAKFSCPSRNGFLSPFFCFLLGGKERRGTPPPPFVFHAERKTFPPGFSLRAKEESDACLFNHFPLGNCASITPLFSPAFSPLQIRADRIRRSLSFFLIFRSVAGTVAYLPFQSGRRNPSFPPSELGFFFFC